MNGKPYPVTPNATVKESLTTAVKLDAVEFDAWETDKSLRKILKQIGI